jgi:CheY-like chemotaxis protein
MPNRGHIIIVNDNPVDADVLKELLENNGYRVFESSTLNSLVGPFHLFHLLI